MNGWRLVWRWVDIAGPQHGVAAGLYRRTPSARPHGGWVRVGRYYYGASRRQP